VITLHNADCLDVLAAMPDGAVDCVITDPPYGADDTHAGHLSSVVLRNGEPARQALGFAGISSDAFCLLTVSLLRVARRWVVMTCEWKYMHLLDEMGVLIRFGVWHKPDGAPQFTGDRPGMGWEAVAVCHGAGRKRWNGGGRHAVWTEAKGDGHSGHPTAKPIRLVRQLVRDFSDPGETVFDPFLGSGTTGVACVELGRSFIGCEIDPKYFAMAQERIGNAKRNKRFDLPLMARQTALIPRG